MSKSSEPVLYRNEQELAALRARIAQSEHEIAAGLAIDITDVDSETFARELLEEAERLGIDPDAPPAPERTR